MGSLRSRLVKSGDYYMLREDMSFIKIWWTLYWYSREIFLLNERAKARKLAKEKPGEHGLMLSMVRRYKAKDFSRAQIFAFYVRVLRMTTKSLAEYGQSNE